MTASPDRHSIHLPEVPGLHGPLVMRWARPLAVGVTIAVLAFAAVTVWFEFTAAPAATTFAVDYGHYLDGTRRWLETGTPYLPRDVAGPFSFEPLTFLHPPVALLLFLPFLILPAILWWAIPIGIVVWSVWAWRPAMWAWPLMALMLAYPRAHVSFMVGNTDMWIWAAVALGLRFGWPALLTVVKPSLFPLLLAGAHRRSWWLGSIVVALLCLPFGALWIDWVHVILNAPSDLTYSFANIPWLLLPVLAWFARTSDPATGGARRQESEPESTGAG